MALGGSHVSNAEAQFLLLVARRVLNHKRNAARGGEEYHDLTPFTPLSCGMVAKMRFDETPTGVEAVLLLKNHPQLTDDDVTKAASNILGGAVKLLRIVEGVREYSRLVVPS